MIELVVWAHAGNGVAGAAHSTVPEPEARLELRWRLVALGSNVLLVVQQCPTVLKRG